MGKVYPRRRPNPQVTYTRPTDAVCCECPPGTSLPAASAAAAAATAATAAAAATAATAAAGPRFKVSSRRRKSMLPLGRPPYLYLKYTTRRRSAASPTPPPADPLESDETNRLRQKLHELELEGEKLIPREKWLRNKVRELRRKMIVTQIALFDWERRSSLPKNLPPSDIQGILRDDQELNSKFNKFSDLELAEAAIAISDELRAKQEEKHQGDIQNCRFEKRKDPALKRPIYNLVFQTREHNILQLCKGRVVLFENKTKDKIKQAKQVRELLSHVDSVVAANNGKPFSDDFIAELKEGALRTLDQVKNVESLKDFTGYTEEHITDLKNEIYKSHNDQLARITEMVEQRLQQSVERLERQLADEQAAREAAVNSAQEAHKRSAEEIRELRKSLEKAKEESEDFRRRAAEHKCAIL